MVDKLTKILRFAFAIKLNNYIAGVVPRNHDGRFSGADSGVYIAVSKGNNPSTYVELIGPARASVLDAYEEAVLEAAAA